VLKSSQKAYITWGGYQTEGMYNNSETSTMYQHFYDESIQQITAHQVKGSFHWELNMVNFRVGNGTEGKNSKEFEFRPSVNRAFTDTGTTFVLVPKTDFF